jgi:hypothetical protein
MTKAGQPIPKETTKMTKLAMFARLTKADAAQRLVYGTFDETPDRAKEVFDYDTSKPLIKAWSDDRFAKSNGKSFGNVRGQHNGKIAAGVVTEITFNDDLKKVDFVAHIVDDNEWEKVEAGVYTGFSPGGSYAKRWKDGAYNRYTADFAELSIVDVPCNPAAYFTMVKADGVEDQVEFVLGKAYEPGNDATKQRAEAMAKAAAGTTYKDHVIQARADLIAEHAVEALAKMAEPEPADNAAAIEAAFAKADAAVAAVIEPVVEADPISDMAKGLEQIATALDGQPMAKGLRGIQSLAGAIYQVVAVQAACQREAEDEGDGSMVPAQIVDGIKTLTDALIAMAQEEVAELMSDITEAGMEEAVPDWSIYECAAPIIDLVKADTALMEKVGARNNKADAAKIQSMHDTSVQLGAACAVAKAAGLESENERLSKAVDAALPRLEKLADDLTAAKAEIAAKDARIAELGKLPALTKAQLAHDKGDDGFAKADDADEVTSLSRQERAERLLARVRLSRI